ncbi:DsbA family protein [Roseobacter sinensis]|uniref:DsbA family protein n=1 Tax=Roseobacter sinensis TaxID=2931391 RepID=A0ABT3B8N9_9RHOB|nr:DsbA family protein [Roseobacter sp. WL0113]MCV3269942.1 DsbA family protein [Roseobacter sp. WL0113]
MRRRDLLIIGGACAVALAIPPILRRRNSPFEFSEMPGLPGFRRLERGALSGGVDVLAGLQTPEEAAARGRLTGDLCAAIFPQAPAAGLLPVAVFSDYYCPYCAVLDRRLADLEAADAGISLIFHELPLLGERSVRAAKVALAAAQQAPHTEIHLAMMQNVLRPGLVGLRDVAARHGLDADRLARDAASPAIEEQVQDALALGRALDMPGTPGLVVGRTVVVGALSEDELSVLIALEKERGAFGCV